MQGNKLQSQAFTYDLKDASMRKQLLRARRLVQKLNRINVNNTKKKNAILSELFGSIGQKADLNPNFYCDFGSHIFIGNNFFCNYNCTMLDIATIRIGDDCLFGPNVSLYTAGHPIDLKGRLDNIGTGAPITISNGVWIGGSCVIMGGVTIGDNAVIGAGSVVTRDVPPNTVAVGSPAKVIRRIEENEAYDRAKDF